MSEVGEGPVFNTSLPIDATPRVSPSVISADKQSENPTIPWYVADALDVRNALMPARKNVELTARPESEFTSAEQFFSSVQERSVQIWAQYGQEGFGERVEDWKGKIQASSIEDKQNIIDILANSSQLEVLFQIRQFGALEDVKEALPDVWCSMMLISAERQYAQIALARRWVKETTPQEFTNFGLSKAELEIYLDTTGILGKYIDHGYIRQAEYAALPGGSNETPLAEAGNVGGMYMYELPDPDTDEYEKRTYEQMLPFEVGRISQRIKSLVKIINKRVDSGELGSEYSTLAGYLTNFGELQSSKETDPDKLNEKWEALYKQAYDLFEKGVNVVPLAMTTDSVAGDAAKADLEIRMGLRTAKTREQEAKVITPMSNKVDSINSNNQGILTDLEPARILLCNTPFAFGPNLYWDTRGEERQNIVHPDANERNARLKELPFIRSLGITEATVSDEEYIQVALFGTIAHELGHKVLPATDSKVVQRMGITAGSNVLDESKAEGYGFVLQDEVADQKLLARLAAILGTNVDYLLNKSSTLASSGERYYLTGYQVVQELQLAGFIGANGQIDTANEQAAATSLRGFGNKVLSYYTDPNITPANVDSYLAELRTQTGQKLGVTDIIAQLRTKVSSKS